MIKFKKIKEKRFQVSIFLNKEDFFKLKRIAKTHKVTHAHVIRVLISEFKE